MKPFTYLDSVACPLPFANVDTDQLIPARFMKEPRSVGYGQFLLHDLRFDRGGSPVSEFALNQPSLSDAKIMVARRNFGAGSSREAAVYALVDYGFRCVIAPSFGDIFSANAVNNGVLPAIVSEADADLLLRVLIEKLDSKTGAPALHVDLNNEVIVFDDVTVSLSIKPEWKLKLLNGWDDIDLTMNRQSDIERFVDQYRQTNHWALNPSDRREYVTNESE